MHISSIEISNFKGIGNSPQKFEFSPITMMFGANGVGKSTILHAIGYLYEIFINKNLNPSHLATCKNIFIGGYEGLVHNHEIEREIKFGIELVGLSYLDIPFPNMAYTQFATRMFQRGLYIGPGDEFEGDESGIAHCKIEITLAFNKQEKDVFIVNSTILINDEHLCDVFVREGVSNLHNFNYLHRLFQPNIEYLKTKELFNHKLEDIKQVDWGASFPIILKSYQQEPALLPMNCNDIRFPLFSIDDITPFEFLSNVASDCDEVYWHSDRKYLEAFDLANFIVSYIKHPVNMLSKSLRNIVHIGPIREVPSAYFEPTTPPTMDGWYTGKSAWDSLFKAEKLTHNVNKVLEDDLSLPYKIKFIGTTISPLLRLEYENKVDISPTDTGVGISQLIPVVVSLVKDNNLTLIEQPELHTHPKLQLKIADFIITSSISPVKHWYFMNQDEFNNLLKAPQNESLADLVLRPFGLSTPWGKNNSLSPQLLKYLLSHGKLSEDIVEKIVHFEKCKQQIIIETHSEHIILRLLRRIRESDKGINIKDICLMPGHVKVNCLSKTQGKLKVEGMRITIDGDFEKDWPDGFFDERDEELF